MSADDVTGRAAELDGPGAIVSHAEVAAEYLSGNERPSGIADTLGVSVGTARRLLRNLRRAGILS